MDEATIRGQVRGYIVDSFLDGREEGFSDETDLIETGLLDSFSVLELAVFLNERFSEEIALDSLTTDDLRDVNSITAAVRRTIATPAAAE